MAFGCSDSIVIIRDGKPTVVANPDASGERVGAMVADMKGEIFVGDWAADFQVTAPWVKGRSAANVAGNPGSVAVTNAAA